MNYNKYIKFLGNIYGSFMKYVDCIDDNDDDNDEHLQQIIDVLEKRRILMKRYSLQEIMTLINKISKRHHRIPNFINRIEKILLYLAPSIKETFSNYEIFDLFKNNKRILLFLIHQEIVTIDDELLDIVDTKSEKYSNDFYFYFFKEVKEKVSVEKKQSIEDQLLQNNPNVFDDFEKKREIGENDSYICSLIREDSIEEFVQYVTRKNISLTSKIKSSIFETNTFLLYKEPSLIEYAAFHGSIQIFQFLRLNNVELEPSLWLYAINSRNAQLIHLLEENHVIPDEDESYEDCFTQSIKCHHNEIADYIQDNLLKRMTRNCKIKIIRYYNYQYFEQVVNLDLSFFNLYKYGHNRIINLYIKTRENSIEKEINILNLYV